jgi:3-deoxy-7-phosphoheptulonate synthase
MIIILRRKTEQSDIDMLRQYLENKGVEYEIVSTIEANFIKIKTFAHLLDLKHINQFSSVLKAVRLSTSAPLVSSEKGKKRKVIELGGVKIGGDEFTVIAGPCSLEDEVLFLNLVKYLKSAGVRIIRAGAYKPRTSPYSFQGLGEKGLDILQKASTELGVLIVTEIMDVRDMDLVYRSSDIIQVGMRNMRNYSLLKEAGKQDKPVLLKRASDATVDEWLLAAEYILNEGNMNVILCERGVTNSLSCKSVILDLNGALEVRNRSILPVIIDPSHAGADRSLVPALARASAAADLDGIMVEVHTSPKTALSDGFQAILPEDFKNLLSDIGKIRNALKG